MIKRDPKMVSARKLRQLVEVFHAAIVEAVKVEPDDVEIDTRDISRYAKNCYPLTVEIDSGPGKKRWRIKKCRLLLRKINLLVESHVPESLRKKRKSNLWLRIYAKGASMPIGCPELAH